MPDVPLNLARFSRWTLRRKAALASFMLKRRGNKHVKRRRHRPSILAAALIMLGTIPGIAAASEGGGDNRGFTWTKGAGLSYPLVASVSGGLHAPLFRDPEAPRTQFGAVAVQANVDLGIGGAMASGGIFVRVGSDGLASVSAIIVKAAALRTWVLDPAAERDRPYRGAVIEYFVAAAGMGGKIGLGHFRSNRSAPSPDDGFVYLYVGLGL